MTQSSNIPAVLAFLSATGTLPILTYCAASILMTVTNKYVLSGYDFNMNFLLLGIQVCFYFLLFILNVELILTKINTSIYFSQ
jgi:hypothetical protein